jgi:hypothetical protein
MGDSEERGKVANAVFTSSVAQYVFKNNRMPIPPEHPLSRAGLLPTDEAQLVEVGRLNTKCLPAGRLEVRWDPVRSSSKPRPAALSWYNSAY